MDVRGAFLVGALGLGGAAFACTLTTNLDGLSGPPASEIDAASGGSDGSADADHDAAADAAATRAPILFVLGGADSTEYATAGFVTTVNEDGSLGPWTATAPMPSTRYRGAAVATNDRVVLLGGELAGGMNADRALIGTVEGGSIVSWTESVADRVIARARNGAIAHRGLVHIFAGLENGTASTTVAVAGGGPEVGLGAWSAEPPLPAPAAAFGASVVDDRVYLVTGAGPNDGGPGWVGDMAPSGSITAWRAIPALPNGRTTIQSASAASATHVYACGGYSSTAYDWVSVASVGADGMLGAWQDTSPLMVGRAAHTMAVARGRVYVIGGEDGAGNTLSSVEVATIRSDGMLDAFTAARPLPAPRHFHASVVVSE